jgi:hypothetical protein
MVHNPYETGLVMMMLRYPTKCVFLSIVDPLDVPLILYHDAMYMSGRSVDS